MANDEGEKNSFYALEMVIEEQGDGKTEHKAHHDENSPEEHVSPLLSLIFKDLRMENQKESEMFKIYRITLT
jgi:hypothetical protein